MGDRTLTVDMKSAIQGLEVAIGRITDAIDTDPETAGDANLCGLNVCLFALLGRFRSHLSANYD